MLFIQNWIFIDNVYEIKIHLQHLWSIAVEEQIYLVFPVFLLLVRNKKRILGISLFLFFLIPLCRYLYLEQHTYEAAYKQIFWNTFFRLDAFLAGVLIYFFHRQLISYRKYLNGIYALGMICFLCMLTWIIINGGAEKNNPFIAIVGYSLIAIMYASILAASISSTGSIVSKITNLSFLKFTGKISYGLYIIHWPILIISYSFLNRLSNYFHFSLNQNAFQLTCAAGSTLVTYLLAYLSYRYFESWFLKRKVSLR